MGKANHLGGGGIGTSLVLVNRKLFKSLFLPPHKHNAFFIHLTLLVPFRLHSLVQLTLNNHIFKLNHLCNLKLNVIVKNVNMHYIFKRPIKN